MLPRLLLDLRRELGRTVRLTLELLCELRHLSFQFRFARGCRAHQGERFAKREACACEGSNTAAAAKSRSLKRALQRSICIYYIYMCMHM